MPQLKDFVHERYLPYVRTYKTSWQTDETVLRIHILPQASARWRSTRSRPTPSPI